MNRLSSFLLHEGDIETIKISPIKTNIFFIETKTKAYILKGYLSGKAIIQQWQFFHRVRSEVIIPFVPFPNKQKVIEGFGMYWVLSPFIEGNTLHFSRHQDRSYAVKTLTQFHKVSHGIQISNPIHRKPINDKWKKRLAKFQTTRQIMVNNGYEILYQDICRVYKECLALFTIISSGDKDRQHQWIHGDVASHNFINSNGMVYLIDFDLLAPFPAIFDYIQLGQRFLPFINNDLEELVTYFSNEQIDDINFWLSGMAIPTDVVREWWHFIQQNPSSQQLVLYLKNMNKAWNQRLEFVNKVKDMLTY